jgi:hypothetical protein
LVIFLERGSFCSHVCPFLDGDYLLPSDSPWVLAPPSSSCSPSPHHPPLFNASLCHWERGCYTLVATCPLTFIWTTPLAITSLWVFVP